MAISNIQNNEGGGSVREKLNEAIAESNLVANKVDKIPTATPGNAAIFGIDGAIIDSGMVPGGGESVNIPQWEDVQFIPLPLAYTVQYNGRLFASKIVDNLNNTPPLEEENDYWIEISEATGNGFGNYSVGIYSADPSMVVFDQKLYLLNTDVVTLPFNSTDFADELSENKWVLQGGGGLTPEQAAELEDSKIENIFFTALAPDYGVVTRPYNFKVTTKVDTGGISTIKTSADVAYTLNDTVLAGGYLKVTADTLLMRTHLTIERAV